jgi:hypothetical protein
MTGPGASTCDRWLVSSLRATDLVQLLLFSWQVEIAERSVLAKNAEMRADSRCLEDLTAAPAGVGAIGMLGERAVCRTAVIDGDKEQVWTAALRNVDSGIEGSIPRC